ncbi:MAG: hemolysin family channel protein [Gemmatimonadetes bacterium]|jgi:hemolysin III|nr:hemolysin family channel protein [Gemmatimonadota bacterium]
MSDPATVTQKPSWRGVQHQWAAVFALGVGTCLVALAPTATARIAAGIYAASLVLLLTVSAVYHRFQWTPGVRTWLRRADHASIFLLIGGTYTPIAMLAIGGDDGRSLMTVIWSGVAAGVLVSMLWPGAPKFVSAAIAVAVGWTIVPYIDTLVRVLDATELWLIVVGGIAYTVGAVVYAVKRPNPWPQTFGYHEVFHALTLVGAGLHLAAVLSILRTAAG